MVGLEEPGATADAAAPLRAEAAEAALLFKRTEDEVADLFMSCMFMRISWKNRGGKKKNGNNSNNAESAAAA